jgi:hypothetical protein
MCQLKSQTYYTKEMGILPQTGCGLRNHEILKKRGLKYHELKPYSLPKPAPGTEQKKGRYDLQTMTFWHLQNTEK